MSTSNSDLNERCTALRQELKLWEKQFAADHEGRKAGREDIKANTAISQKYKEYNKIRDIISGKSDPQTPSKAPGKRKSVEEILRTPSKRLTSPLRTPKKQLIEANAHPNAPIYSSKLLTPARVPSIIGPTPQKDGLALGLFDLLSSETPSKAQRTVLGDIIPNVLQTPSKDRGRSEDEFSMEGRGGRSRTPLSTGKRYLLDKFATPQKRKRDNEDTPSSALKYLSTPMFLRRDTHSLDMIAEEDETTPRPAPWKRRGLGRSLSSMIQSLRRQEEEKLDEELEIMREMEMEAAGISLPKKTKVPDILVEDSQAPMRLGPDGYDGSGQEDSRGTDAQQEGLGQNGKPRKVWKKRGQKRQTKRIIMRPVTTKPKPQSEAQSLDHGSDESDGIEETQGSRDAQDVEDGSCENLDEPTEDECASDYSDDSHTPKKRKTEPKKKAEAHAKQVKDLAATKDEGTVKRAVRKVSASAHANYRRLKIKSKNSKGQGKGRFGRRR